MEADNIKVLLSDKSTLQIVWILFFTFFLAIAKVFYDEVKVAYQIVRSGILSISAGMITGLACYYFEVPFIGILFLTSIMSFTGEKFFDGIIGVAKQFPDIFTNILKSYINGRGGKQ